MKIFSAVLRLSIRFMKEKHPNYKKDRREALAKDDQKSYSIIISEYMQGQNIIKSKVLEELLKLFEVSPIVFNKSQQNYKTDPQFAPRFQQDAASFEHAEHRQEEGCDITKEEAFGYIRKIEEFKAETNAQLALATRLQRLPQ